MSKYRKALQRIYAPFYKRHFTEGGFVCFYCNEPGYCLDHVPPISYILRYSISEWHKLKIPLVLLVSCQRCNIWLGDKPLFTIQERLEYLIDRYNTNISIKLPSWSTEELSLISVELALQITKKLELRNLRLHQLQQLKTRLLDINSWPKEDDDGI